MAMIWSSPRSAVACGFSTIFLRLRQMTADLQQSPAPLFHAANRHSHALGQSPGYAATARNACLAKSAGRRNSLLLAQRAAERRDHSRRARRKGRTPPSFFQRPRETIAAPRQRSRILVLPTHQPAHRCGNQSFRLGSALSPSPSAAFRILRRTPRLHGIHTSRSRRSRRNTALPAPRSTGFPRNIRTSF